MPFSPVPNFFSNLFGSCIGNRATVPVQEDPPFSAIGSGRQLVVRSSPAAKRPGPRAMPEGSRRLPVPLSSPHPSLRNFSIATVSNPASGSRSAAAVRSQRADDARVKFTPDQLTDAREQLTSPSLPRTQDPRTQDAQARRHRKPLPLPRTRFNPQDLRMQDNTQNLKALRTELDANLSAYTSGLKNRFALKNNFADLYQYLPVRDRFRDIRCCEPSYLGAGSKPTLNGNEIVVRGRSLGSAMQFPKPDQRLKFLEGLAGSGNDYLCLVNSGDFEKTDMQKMFDDTGAHASLLKQATAANINLTIEHKPAEKISLRNEDHAEVGYIDVYQLKIGGKSAKIFHYPGWDDYTGCDQAKLLSLAQKALELRENKPLWIGCRAGVGRTGTLFAAMEMQLLVDSGLEDEFSLETTIQELRACRSESMVQSDAQMETLIQLAKHHQIAVLQKELAAA